MNNSTINTLSGAVTLPVFDLLHDHMDLREIRALLSQSVRSTGFRSGEHCCHDHRRSHPPDRDRTPGRVCRGNGLPKTPGHLPG